MAPFVHRHSQVGSGRANVSLVDCAASYLVQILTKHIWSNASIYTGNDKFSGCQKVMKVTAYSFKNLTSVMDTWQGLARALLAGSPQDKLCFQSPGVLVWFNKHWTVSYTPQTRSIKKSLLSG